MKRKLNHTHFKSFDIEALNADLPINLRKLEPLIDNISSKYPLLKKSEISIIIKAFIEEMRVQLLKGNSINLFQFLLEMKLYTFCKVIKNKLYFNTRIAVTTPEKIKNKLNAK